MIFDAVDKAPEGTRPAWFDFEKDCARLLRSRQMQVVHQAANRDGDGGVDLYAITDAGESWIVQCKCWATHRSVGPNVVRELEGALRLADAGSSKRSKGLIITTSTFTEGTKLAALELGFELIDGNQFSVFLKAITL
jgi:restriction endonuclease Mrr